jgi:hypothetical protein
MRTGEKIVRDEESERGNTKINVVMTLIIGGIKFAFTNAVAECGIVRVGDLLEESWRWS